MRANNTFRCLLKLKQNRNEIDTDAGAAEAAASAVESVFTIVFTTASQAVAAEAAAPDAAASVPNSFKCCFTVYFCLNGVLLAFEFFCNFFS